MAVCLPNFGDEKGIVDTLKMARLNVPALVQAYPDELRQLSPARRRDSFCGKISVSCLDILNVLYNRVLRVAPDLG